MTEQEHIKKWIDHAREKFADFTATFKQFDGISTLDWRHKNGSFDYYMRVIFDEDRECMYISGDLGDAVFQFTEKAMIERISRYSSFYYFMEKMQCSSDEYINDGLTDRLSECDPDYREWLYCAGRRIHPRVIIWWTALKLAAKQLGK